MKTPPEIPMSDTPLFREAAIKAQRVQLHGEIVMSQPLSYRVLAVAAAVMASVLIGFAILGTYTKRTTISGQIMPTTGLLKLYAQQSGIVLDERVAEGMKVNKDDVLFVISGERKSSTMGSMQAGVTQQAKIRRQSFREQFDQTKRLATLERDALMKRTFTLRQELDRLDALILGQRERVLLSEQMMTRYGQLSKEGYVTQDQVMQKHAELLDQRARLDGILRDRVVASRNLDDAVNELKSSPLKVQNELGEIARDIAGAEQELSESEVRRQVDIVATESGTATAITAKAGQLVDPSKPLVSIVPSGARWQAQLYAPSRAVGFIKPGDRVRLRYHAFPYQQFGQYGGKVSSISTSGLSSVELTGTNVFANGAAQGGEPLYRILVDLDSQDITAYGGKQALQAGMLLDADILQETRRLYEWILEPLLALSGKL